MKNGWEIKRLGEVCEVDKCQGVNKNLPYVGLEDIESNTGRFLGSTVPRIVKSNTFTFSQKHLLYGRLRPYLNKVMLPDFVGHCSTEIFPLKPDGILSRKYLMYWFLMSSTVDQINATCTGARMPRANINSILEFEFPLAPQVEQQRIVEILDEAFDGIATVKANAEKNLANARDLFNAWLNSVFSQRGEGWREKRLVDIADIQSGGTPLVSNKKYWNGNIPWYSSGELNARLTDEPARNITEDGLNNSNAKIFPKGSLLIGMYDTAALKMSILDRDATFNQAIAGVRPNDMIEMEYIFHVINALKPKLLLQRRGARQNNLSLQKIKDIVLPIPSLPEQRNIIHTCNQALSETQRLESIYRQKIEALNALKQSILHQAFSGAL